MNLSCSFYRLPAFWLANVWPYFLDNISGVSPSLFVMAVSVPWLIKQFMAGMCPDAAQCAGVFPKSERKIDTSFL